MLAAKKVKLKKVKPKNEWEPLKSGDIVDVIAPASKCPGTELVAGIKVLESWGLEVRVPEDLFGDHLMHANTDERRWTHLHNALVAKDSSAIWCARGGYGSMKLLPRLAKLKLPKKPKAFLGLSDITSLNVFFAQRWKWPVLHSPILSRVGRGDLPPATISELKQVLFGEAKELEFNIKPLNDRAAKTKKIDGIINGGNWATLTAGIGTPYAVKSAKQILFLEDIGERGYRLDRFWEQMLQVGMLDKIEAIVFGDFTEGNEPDGSNLIWPILRERAAQFKKPVYHGLPVGHGMIQRVLPLGVRATIERNKDQIQLIVPSGAC